VAPASSSQDEEKKRGPSKKRRKLFTHQEMGDPSFFLVTPKKRMETPTDMNNNTRPGESQQGIDTTGTNVSVSELGRQVLLRTGLDAENTPGVAVAMNKGRKRKRTVSLGTAKAVTNSQGKNSNKPVAKNADVSKSAVKISQNGPAGVDTGRESENVPGAEKTNNVPAKSDRRKSVSSLKALHNDEGQATTEVKRGNRRKSVMFPVEDSVEKTAESPDQTKRSRRKSAIGTAKNHSTSVVAADEKTRGGRRKSTIGTVGGTNTMNDASVDTGEQLKRSRRKSVAVTSHLCDQSEGAVVAKDNTKKGRRKSTVATVEKVIPEITSEIGEQEEIVEEAMRGRRKSIVGNIAVGAQSKKGRRISSTGNSGEKVVDDKVTKEKGKTVKGRRKSTLMNKKDNTELNSIDADVESVAVARGRRKSTIRTPSETVVRVETPSSVEKRPRNKRFSILSSTKTKTGAQDSETSTSSLGGEGNSSGSPQNRSIVTRIPFSRMSIEDFSVSPTVHRVFKGVKNTTKKTPSASGSISTAFGDDSSDSSDSEAITHNVKLTGKGKGKSQNISTQKSAKTNINTEKSEQSGLLVDSNSDTGNQMSSTQTDKGQHVSFPASTQKNRKTSAADVKLTGKKIVKRAKSCSSLPKSPLPVPLYSKLLETRKASAATRNLPSIVTTSLHFR
jgi:hypothetical protein